MLPQIDNADQAQLAVRYSKYPPAGSRGVSPMWTFYNNVDWKDYLPEANDEIMVVAQVESAEALDQVEAIAATPGVDVVFAGPADLAASLGHIGDTTHPKVQQFLADFPARVTKYGKAAGISVGGVEASFKAYTQGYRFINYGNLLWEGANGLKANLKQLRERVGNEAGQ
jgi:2-keto-3-deoxy-L-rhamnonate aldolase RhmA